MTRLVWALAIVAGGVQAADVNHGAELYRQHCAACHGTGGRPALPGTPDLARPGALLKPDVALVAALRSGRGAMPAYGGLMKERELFDVVAHLRTFR